MNKLALETLERWLWDLADLLRGHIDSSDFKNYIFGLLFLKRANDQFMEEAYIAVRDDNVRLGEALYDFVIHRSVGTDKPFINIAKIKKLPITLLSLKEQKQIANILSTTDEKLEILKGKKHKYETLKTGLLKKFEWRD